MVFYIRYKYVADIMEETAQNKGSVLLKTKR